MTTNNNAVKNNNQSNTPKVRTVYITSKDQCPTIPSLPTAQRHICNDDNRTELTTTARNPSPTWRIITTEQKTQE